MAQLAAVDLQNPWRAALSGPRILLGSKWASALVVVFSQFAEKLDLFLLLGGAAVHRCDNWLVSPSASVAEGL